MAQDSQKQAAATNVGERYAQALFDLAGDEHRINRVENDMRMLKELMRESADLRTLIASPAFNAEAKGKGIDAVAAKYKLESTTRKFLGLLAANGRTGLLPSIITSFETLAATHRGAISAKVTSAVPFTEAQSAAIAASLREALGKDPEIETEVDPSILGGVKVKVGSRLFDASVKSKLDQLKFALKRA